MQQIISIQLFNFNFNYDFYELSRNKVVMIEFLMQLMESSVQRLDTAVELNDCRVYARHLRKLARAQEREATNSET